MEYTFRTIEKWPGELSKYRKAAPFRAGWSQTSDLLDHELGQVRAKNIVIQLALKPDEIRLDNRPRADARPSHPGVILSFETTHGPLSFPCDKFDDWRDNVRAIALALEALRKVDRYGVTKTGEQYRGWSQLPPPMNGKMTPEQAASFIVEGSGVTAREAVSDREVARALYRSRAMDLHPDKGGDAEQFKQLMRAKEVLGL